MPDGLGYPRSRCCVPFCRRTSTRFPQEWVCGEHWRLVDRDLKRFRTKQLRKITRLIERYDAEMCAAQAKHTDGRGVTSDHDDIWRAAWKGVHARRRWRRLERAIWRKMKDQAITRAAA